MAESPGADERPGFGAALSLIAAGARARLLAGIAGAILGLAATSLAVRLLGTRDYGTLAFLLSVVTLIPGIAQLGISTGAVRALSHARAIGDHGLVESTMRGTLTIATVSGVLGSLLILSLAGVLPKVGSGATRIAMGSGLAILIFGSEVASGAASVARALGRVVLTEIPLLTLIGGRFLAVLGLFIAGAADLKSISIAYGVTGVAALVLSHRVVAWLRSNVRKPWHVDLRSGRRLVSLAAPYVVMGLAAMALARFDVFVLGLTAGRSEVGEYEPVLKLVERLMLLVPLLFAAQYLPSATALLANSHRNSFRDLYIRLSKISYVMTFPVVIMLAAFPEAVLRSLYGGNFPVRPTIVWILLPGYVVHVALGFNGPSLAAVGARRAMFAVGSAALVTMLTLAVILIPLYSGTGAAVATAVTYAATNLAFAWTLWRTTGVHPIASDLLGVVFTSTLPLAAALAIRWTLHPTAIWTAAAIAIVCWGIWALLLLRFGVVRVTEVTPLLSGIQRNHTGGVPR